MGQVKLPANLFGFNLQRNSDGNTDGESISVAQTIPNIGEYIMRRYDFKR